jgi:hypothetical protein
MTADGAAKPPVLVVSRVRRVLLWCLAVTVAFLSTVFEQGAGNGFLQLSDARRL